MITREQRLELETALTDVFGAQPNARTWLKATFANYAAPLLNEIPPGATNPDFATLTVEFCLRSYFRETPPLMEQLLRRLIDVYAKVALQPLLANVQNRFDPNPDPFTSVWLQHQPFVDRSELRRQAEQLLYSPTQPILRMRGGAGRSYTQWYFEHLANAVPMTVSVVPVSIPPGSAAKYTVEELDGDLAGAFGVQSPFDPKGSQPGAEIWRRISSAAAHTPGCLWVLVFDGFNQQDVGPDVKECVQVIAGKLRAVHATRIRMVLLDFPDVLINAEAGALRYEDIAEPATIGQADVEQCLHALNAERARQQRQPIQSASVPALAAGILNGGAPPGGKARLRHIYDELMRHWNQP